MITLYEPSGYLDIPRILKLKGINFVFLIGARGIGKTYGVCKYLLTHEDATMLLIRRTDRQVELINIPQFSPLAKPAKDLGFEYTLRKVAQGYRALWLESDPPRLLGYTAAMSTFSNIRGFDASDINFIFYDEFMPEKGERDIKGEGSKFLNMYETVNRNRELQGERAVKAICASNSNDINSPILRELDLVDVCARMQEREQEIYMNTARGIAVIMPQNSPISKAKAKTALYRAVDPEGDFAAMALDNSFDEIFDVKSYPLQEFKPLATIDGITVYMHKARNFIYISLHQSGACEIYDGSDAANRQFRAAYAWLYDAYMSQRIVFESLQAKQKFEKIIF